MDFERVESRLQYLVERSARGIARLPAADHEKALRDLLAVIHEHALRRGTEQFAADFSAMFLQAVRSRIEDMLERRYAEFPSASGDPDQASAR